MKGESTKEILDRKFALVTAMATEAEKELPDNIRERLEHQRIINYEQEQSQLNALSEQAEKEIESQINH